ncbi:MAG: RNA polymerase sigma factor [Terriglobia bacterium]
MSEASKGVSSLTDQSLMQQVRDGDVGKLGILFERHHGMLFSFLLRLTGDRTLSEDLVQEVFVRLLKYRHTYRGESQFTTWMFQIARNLRVDHFRKHRREGDLNEEQATDYASADPTPGEQVVQNQEARLLKDALSRLSPEKREVLLLTRFHNLKHEEIAEILGCSVPSVKARVFRAMQDLRESYFELTGERVS